MFYKSYFLSKNPGFYIKWFDINAYTSSEVIKEVKFSIKVPDCTLNFIFLWHGMAWTENASHSLGMIVHFYIPPYSIYSGSQAQ